MSDPALDDRCDPHAIELELRAEIARWREHMPADSTLADPIDPDRDHLIGDPAAAIVLVEYGDYQCSECAEAHRLRGELDGWIDEGSVSLVFRHFPLVDAHPRALRAAEAVEAAAQQGRFVDMHDLLMASESVTDDAGQEHVLLDADLSDEGLLRAARHLDLDLEEFRATMDARTTCDRIVGDFRSGVRSGVNGTPTFYLNGERQDVIGPEELIDRVRLMPGDR